jgi:hypothetical protein
MNDLPETLELLSARIDALEKRLDALEHPSATLVEPFALPQAAPTAAATVDENPIDQTSGAFAVLGKAMLGIAGAYVLRAVAESSLVSGHVIAAVAIAYAVAWLVVATRASARAYFAGAVYAATSSMILTPMLWELTLRFKVLSPEWAAGVLGGFVVVAAVLSLTRNRLPVFWVAQGAAAVAALALSIATHAMVPFIVALLLMVLVCELANIRHRKQPVRPLVAALTDVAIWALIFIYSGAPSTRADYPALGTAALVAPACLLFLIDAVNIAIRTAFLSQSITIYETVQATVAFLLAASSVLYFTPHSGAIVMGIACLILSAASYAAAFVRFRPFAAQRNFRVFSAWSTGLLLAGVLWGLPAEWMPACLGLAALAAIALGIRMECMTLECHGVIYLVAAAIAAGLPEYAYRSLAGPLPSKPPWSILLVSTCAMLSYAIARERRGEAWRQQILHLVPSLLAACSVAALMVQGLLWLAALAITTDVVHVALIRTLILCSVALALAFGGAWWRRLEMTRIAYATLAFVAAKLLFEDLRHSRMEFIAASIFLFAVTLIGVPRLARMGHKT